VWPWDFIFWLKIIESIQNEKEYQKTPLIKGQIIFLGTDGIWEATNLDGEMFGKERIRDAIRKYSSSSAEDILNNIFTSLNNFQQGAPIEDDITLVIIKVN
jgi:sigma-B regulation protein RsbU (phosphoserine phosphatase)